jgi:hypothetical protein
MPPSSQASPRPLSGPTGPKSYRVTPPPPWSSGTCGGAFLLPGTAAQLIRGQPVPTRPGAPPSSRGFGLAAAPLLPWGRRLSCMLLDLSHNGHHLVAPSMGLTTTTSPASGGEAPPTPEPVGARRQRRDKRTSRVSAQFNRCPDPRTVRQVWATSQANQSGMRLCRNAVDRTSLISIKVFAKTL